jgi:hypothetical protein
MKRISRFWLIIVLLLPLILIVYPKRAHPPKPKVINPMGLESYFIDDNRYPKPQTDPNEMVICAYDGRKMRKVDASASMLYRGKILYFYTLDEMVKYITKKGILAQAKSTKN